jgi:hypothetical protein
MELLLLKIYQIMAILTRTLVFWSKNESNLVIFNTKDVDTWGYVLALHQTEILNGWGKIIKIYLSFTFLPDT